MTYDDWKTTPPDDDDRDDDDDPRPNEGAYVAAPVMSDADDIEF